jgi:predicted kinase
VASDCQVTDDQEILETMTDLILFGGLAASGKSTLGREIAQVTRFAFLDKDTITKPLVEALLLAAHAPDGVDDRQSERYVNQVRPYEYQAFLDTVIENVGLGVSTIAVAPFLREMADQAWLDTLQAQLPGAAIHKLWLAPSEDLLYERLRSRNSPRDSHKLSNWAEYMESCRRIKPCDSCTVIHIEASDDLPTLVKRVLKIIER